MKSKLFIIHTENQANIFVLGFAIFLLLFSTITRAAVFVSNFDNVTPPTLSIPPSWQIIRLETHVVKSANMTKRQGDDYAARVYLAFSLPKETLTLADKAALAIARSIFGSHVPDAAINYVWDNIHPIGTRAPNAYTSRAQMVVLRTGNSDSGKWMAERVNVLDDLHRSFGTLRGKLKLLAIASDSDNTKEKARAGFAEIAFVKSEENCPAPSTPN